jgi:hypothetical protein
MKLYGSPEVENDKVDVLVSKSVAHVIEVCLDLGKA